VKKRLFYVRRHTSADGSFEWYVLNGQLRRVGKMNSSLRHSSAMLSSPRRPPGRAGGEARG
jgi:hypothetical protein